MADNLMLKNILGDDYNQSPRTNAVYLNGKLRYFDIDIDQPGKYFFNLTDAFNASVDEGNKVIPIRLNRGGENINLNGWGISADGVYPDDTTPFSITSSIVSASPAYIRFNLPLGLFQAVGVYKFQFTFKNATTGEILKSPWQFFNVTQSATNMALDLNNGIEPYDSEYLKWKDKVEKQINALQDQLGNINVAASQMQDLINQYISQAEQYAESAWEKKLQQDNTWGGTQSFNKASIKDFSADNVNSNSFSGSNMTLDGLLTLSTAPALKYVGGNIARGLMTFEDEFFVATNPADNRGGANFVNGVEPGAGGQNYMNIRVFRIPDTNGETTHVMTNIHANCKIPDSAVGKAIIQFPSSTHMFEGIDQTPFFLGNWVLQFSGADKTLRVQGKIDSSGTNNLQDSKMI